MPISTLTLVGNVSKLEIYGMMMKNETSRWWWFESRQTSRRSPWLQSTLSELDRKTKVMLKLIEEDADSFAQRAEMYYKKRPELVSMVEDFYREHRSLVERYDQLKCDYGVKDQSNKTIMARANVSDQTSDDSQSETYYSEELAGSDVDDPEFVEQKDTTDVAFTKLREENRRLREENAVHKQQLLQKDGEKREVIKQLSFALDDLRLENLRFRKSVARNCSKKKYHLNLEKLKEVFWGILF